MKISKGDSIRISFLLLITIGILTVFSHPLYASGLTLSEQGQPGVGTACVGQAAEADDASTTFFNPAGMTNLKRSEVLAGGELLIIKENFSSDGGIINPFTGGDGGEAGMLLPAGGFYYAQDLYKGKMWGGLAVNSLAGLGIDYEEDWRGRYLIQDSLLLVLNINPTIAAKITEWLSVGGGVSVMYSYLKQHNAIPTVLPLGTNDGQVEMKFDDWQVGWNLGVMVKPTKKARVGVAYRSEAKFNLEGDMDLSNLGTLLSRKAIEDNYGKTELIIPQSIMVSLYQGVTDKWALLGDVGWQQWSTMQSTNISTVSNNTMSINRDWIDTWHIGIGTHYRLFDPLLLRAGFSYDSSPANNRNRLPDMPCDRIWKYAAGCDYNLTKDWVVSAAWEFQDLGPGRIDKQIPSGPAGILFPGRQFSGQYTQYVNLVMLSLRYRFGEEVNPGEKGLAGI